jgi:hypothetical protein
MHGVPCIGRTDVGTLDFIAEISRREKLNFPANFLTIYNGNVNGGLLAYFLRFEFHGWPSGGRRFELFRYCGTFVPEWE